MSDKSSVREKVFGELLKVALPDSRFHYDFSSFIADFHNSDLAISRLVAHPAYTSAKTIFIAPDNCLEQLRYIALQHGKNVLTTSYGIKRGFFLLEPSEIPPEKLLYACTLDGMERIAQPMTLSQVKTTLLSVDYLVTGTGAINDEGVRVGKGHGFFDAEWGMLYSVGVIDVHTPVAAVAHDCQVLSGIKFDFQIFDTVADFIFTPERTIVVREPHKPTCGIVWELLDRHMLETIPPLRELKVMLDM